METGGDITVENLAASTGFAETYDGQRFTLPDGRMTASGSTADYGTYTQVNGYQTDLSASTEQLYGGDGAMFGEGWTYLPPMRQAYRYTSISDGFKMEAISEQSVNAIHNDVEHGRVAWAYSLSADDLLFVDNGGHEVTISSDLRNVLRQQYNRTEVQIYDLLPPGVHFGSCSQAGVEVANIVSNYNGTGREMVEFAVAIPNGTLESVGTVRFDAYIDWDDIERTTIGPNIAAWIPSDGGEIQGTYVSQDNGKVDPVACWKNIADPFSGNYVLRGDSTSDFIGPNGLSLLGSDINGDGVTDARTVLYSSSTMTIPDYAIAYEAGIDKKVKADSAVGTPASTAEIQPGDGYTYYLTIKSRDKTSMRDVTVFDQIENVETNHWQGIFRGVDYSEAVDHGATDVTVWYNAERNAPMPDNKVTSTLVAENVLTAANGWIRSTEWTAPLADVKAVALQLGDMDLGMEQIVTLLVHMAAPSQENFEAGTATYGTAWNRGHMLATVQGTANSVAMTGMHDTRDTSVEILPERPYLYLSKKVEGIDASSVQGDDFTFIIELYDKDAKAFVPAADRESWLVTAACLDGTVPEKLEMRTTGADGSITLKAGQVIALEADFKGQRFRVTEQDPGYGWSCADAEAAGAASALGAEVGITNTWEPGYRLPKTGGPGIAPVLAAGGMLATMAAAAPVLFRKRREDEGRDA